MGRNSHGKPCPLNAARRRMIRIDGGRSGTARPFPLWRLRSGPVRRPSIQNIRERYSDHVPRARTVDQLTCSGLVKFRPHCGFSLSAIQIAQQCGRFATYRRVSRRFVSAICRCITAVESGGRRAGLTRATLRVEFRGPLRAFYRFGGRHDHRQLENRIKRNPPPQKRAVSEK